MIILTPLFWLIVYNKEKKRLEENDKDHNQLMAEDRLREMAKQKSSTKTKRTTALRGLKNKLGLTDQSVRAVDRVSTRKKQKSGQREWKEDDFHI